MSNYYSTDGVSMFDSDCSTKPVDGTSCNTSGSVGFCSGTSGTTSGSVGFSSGTSGTTSGSVGFSSGTSGTTSGSVGFCCGLFCNVDVFVCGFEVCF